MVKLLQEVKARQNPSHPLYYQPFISSKSNLLRDYYKSKLNIPTEFKVITNRCSTIIAENYNRVVIGDYGAYVEFTKEQLKVELTNKFGKAKRRGLKYIWKQTVDSCNTKVYFQLRRVQYADYIPGHYYIDPTHLNWA